MIFEAVKIFSDPKNHFWRRKKFGKLQKSFFLAQKIFPGQKMSFGGRKKFSGTKSHAGSKKNPSGGNPMSFSEGNFSYLTEEDFLFRTLNNIVG